MSKADDLRRLRESRALKLLPGARPRFDRTAYQRVYCRLRRKHGPLALWPPDALAELRSVSVGKRDRKRTNDRP